jgi:hypothetical protein
VVSLTLKLKTRLKIIARVKHASLFSPASYEENRFLTLTHIMKARSSPESSLTLKLKTRLKIIARVKHASLFYPTSYEENCSLTLPHIM